MTLSRQVVLSRVPILATQFDDRPKAGGRDERGQYDLLGSCYLDGLRRIGCPVVVLDAPGIYQTAEARAAIDVASSSPHLAVRPIAALRPFHGLANYFVFDGPVGDLDSLMPGSLRSGLHILNDATRVLCTTASLAEELKLRGIDSAIIFPPPLATVLERDLSPPLAVLNLNKLDGLELMSLGAVCEEAHQAGGQVIYWDAGESADVEAALLMIVDAVEESGLAAKHSALIIAGLDSQYVTSRARKFRDIYRRTYCAADNLSHEDKRPLVRSCDIFVRSAVSPGLDVPAIEALEFGALTLVPTGHSAIEPAGPRSLLAYKPGDETRSRRCPDLIRTLRDPLAISARERAACTAHAREWVQSSYGLSRFENALLALVGKA